MQNRALKILQQIGRYIGVTMLMLLLTLITVLLAYVLCDAITQLTDSVLSEKTKKTILEYILYVAFVAYAIVGAHLLFRYQFLSQIRPWVVNPKLLLLSIAAVFSIVLVCEIAERYLLIGFFGAQEAMWLDRPTTFVLESFISSAVVAPMIEEIIFRGLLLDWFRKHGLSRIGILSTAIIFVGFHLPSYNWNFRWSGIILCNMLGVMVMLFWALFSAWMVCKTESLLYSVITHSVSNMTMYLYQVHVQNIPQLPALIIGILVGCVAVSLLVHFVRKEWGWHLWYRRKIS